MIRPAKRRYLSDASCEAVDGFCVEKKVFWGYDLPREVTTEPERKADLGKICTVAINLLQLLRMVVTLCWLLRYIRTIGTRVEVTHLAGPST